jgi:putative transcriptional regulator
MSKPTRKRKTAARYLDGQMLIAMPSMTDKRFERSVIFMCSHSAKGAMGLIVNQRAKNVSFADLMRELKVSEANKSARGDLRGMSLHIGGPVSTERGFVLHSDDYMVENVTVRVAPGICLTATVDILRALAAGTGPKQALIALGYSGWAPGQLETEIQANGWLNCDSDRDLVFGTDLELKYPRALSKIGVDPSHLVSEAGHA